MSDHTSGVSSGLSLLAKTAKPERMEPMIGRAASVGNVTVFSDDLDKAQLQQLEKTRTQVALSGIGKAGKLVSTNTVASVGVSSTATIQRSNDDANTNAAMVSDSQAGFLAPAQSAEDGSAFQALNSDAVLRLQRKVVTASPGASSSAVDRITPAPMAREQSGAMEERVMPSVLAGRTGQLATGSNIGSNIGGSPENPLIEEQTDADVAGKLVSTDIGESVTDLMPQSIVQTSEAENLNAVVSMDGQGKLPLTATLSEKGDRIQTSNTEVMQQLQPRGAASTSILKDAVPSMTSPAPATGAPIEPRGEIVIPNTLAGRSRLLAGNLEKTSRMPDSPGVVKSMGVGANTAKPAAEPQVTEPQITAQAVKSNLAQTNSMGMKQITSDNVIVTQATLVNRLRQQSHDLAAMGAERLQSIGSSEPLRNGIAPVHAPGLEQPPVSNASMLNNSLSGGDSMSVAIDGNEVQQRIATTEAMLAQMAIEAGNTKLRAPSVDNMLPGLSSGTVAAPAVQHVDSTSGPMIQAPLNLSLTSANAETALAGNVKWMTNEGVKNAVMTVTPHGMGPISIKIGIEGNQMDVSIIASQHTTRDALESMLPRLREQLAIQGHESVKVDVSDGKSDQSRSGNGHAFAESRNPTGAMSQDNQSNSHKNDEKAKSGNSEQSEAVPDSFMAEDLQRVAAQVVGEVEGRPVFDAYV